MLRPRRGWIYCTFVCGENDLSYLLCAWITYIDTFIKIKHVFSPPDWKFYWNTETWCCHSDNLYTLLAALEAVKMTTFTGTSDNKVVHIMTFKIQGIPTWYGALCMFPYECMINKINGFAQDCHLAISDGSLLLSHWNNVRLHIPLHITICHTSVMVSQIIGKLAVCSRACSG